MKKHDHNPIKSWVETRTQLSQSLEFAGEKGQRSISQSLVWIDELEDAGYANKLFLAQNHLALLLSREPYKVGVPVLIAEFNRFEPLVDVYFTKTASDTAKIDSWAAKWVRNNLSQSLPSSALNSTFSQQLYPLERLVARASRGTTTR